MKPGVERIDSPKQTVMRILTMLPDDISFDELMKELVFEWQVQRGLKLRKHPERLTTESDAGEDDQS